MWDHGTVVDTSGITEGGISILFCNYEMTKLILLCLYNSIKVKSYRIKMVNVSSPSFSYFVK